MQRTLASVKMSTHLKRRVNSSHLQKRTKVKHWPERSDLSNPEFLKHPNDTWTKQSNSVHRSWSQAAVCRRGDSLSYSQISHLRWWLCHTTLFRLENLHISAVGCCTQYKLILPANISSQIKAELHNTRVDLLGQQKELQHLLAWTLQCVPMLFGGWQTALLLSFRNLLRAGPACSDTDQNGVLIKLCKKFFFKGRSEQYREKK